MSSENNPVSGAKVLLPRTQWDNGVQFIMTCIGYAVGLGNIWRFPSLAYEHGGGAFLIPYLTCSFVVGFPLLYLEMSLGQFSKSGPAVVYGRIRPLFQGIGWSMAAISLMVSIYYNVIVAWTLIYLYIIFTGRSDEWASCRNSFNTIYCSSALEDARCAKTVDNNSGNGSVGAFFFNGSCHSADSMALFLRDDTFQTLPAVSPAEEFFENYVLEKTATMDTLGGLNYKVVGALAVAWIMTALVLVKGVKMIGRISGFTATVPYIIIIMLFARGITLDGARIGMDFYLLKPKMSAIFEAETWKAAATHVCYSLAIGFGGLLSLSSFNAHNHNCFKDALIITVADGFMSMFGGTAVFSVLGFMSKQLDAKIDTVVQSGTGLAFIAYPEAMSRMPLPWLWSALFFIMLFILGISSQFGLAEVMCTALYDQCPSIRKHKELLAVGVCTTLFFSGLIMTTRAGIFYFNIFNDYSASFSLMLLILLEIMLVVYIYGVLLFKDNSIDEYIIDLRSMMGEPRNCFSRIFGPTGSYLRMIWRYLAPLESLAIFFVTLFSQITKTMTYGKDKRIYYFPDWAILVGWVISTIPLFLLPALIVYNLVKFRIQGRLQPKWTSYERIMKHSPFSGIGAISYWNGVNGSAANDSNSGSITRAQVVPIDIAAPVVNGNGLLRERAWSQK